MPTSSVICADVLDWARSYDGPKFHALLADPPYELAFMGKRWDATGVSFQAETWAALAEHLYPGAFLMAFGASRTYHRLAVAMEDAGLVIHPAVVWVQGSGFPKSTRIGERERVNGKIVLHEDQRFSGHRYGLQAMKPAAEFICVAQKPYSGKPVESITATGAGALWVDGGRIPGAWKWGTQTDIRGGGYGSKRPSDGNIYAKNIMSNPQGRWPPNFALVHRPECERVGTRRVRGHLPPNHYDDANNQIYGKFDTFFDNERNRHADPDGKETIADWQCVDGCPVKALGEHSGELQRNSGNLTWSNRNQNVAYGKYAACSTSGISDTGTAARFFYQADWSYEIAEAIAAADPFYYCPKAGRKERDAGLEGMPLIHGGTMDGGHVVSEGRSAPKTGRIAVRNPHPTVKPIALARWLATLVLPPTDYAPRRLLCPIAGSGSEMIGAGLVGWEEIVGIEFDADTCAIAEARLAHWVKTIQMEMSL